VLPPEDQIQTPTITTFEYRGGCCHGRQRVGRPEDDADALVTFRGP
jgi:hypothetical protein